MEAIRKLKADEIEAKVKSVGEKGAQLLLYKTARTDRQILDEVFGAMNWTSDYKEIKGNLYCGIGCRENPESPFVWKWDCGVESREDGDGNEKKGEASDSFKRAGFQWGIGVELYTSPFIWASVPTKPITDKDGKPILKNNKKIWQLENSYERFSVAEITYDDNGKIAELVIINANGEIVFTTKKQRSEFEKDLTAQKRAANKAIKNGEPKPEPKGTLEERGTKCLNWLSSMTSVTYDKVDQQKKFSVFDIRDALLSSNLPNLTEIGRKIEKRVKELEPPLDDFIPY